MKRCIALILAVVLMGCCFSAQAEYINVPQWAQESYEFSGAMQSGIIPDILEDTDLSGNISRLEFCAVAVKLYNSLSGRAVENEGWLAPFPDVNDRYVNAAYSLGIVTGYPDNTFKPYNSITRQEMFKMLSSLMLCFGQAPVVDQETANTLLGAFSDSSSVQDWARESTVLALKFGITKGDVINGQTCISPQAYTTRAQAIVMAYRFAMSGLNFVGNGTGTQQLPEGVLEPDTPLTTWGYYADTDAKMEYIFGSANAAKYQTEEEAEAHMTAIEVPVWKLDSDGTKYSDTAWITVHEKLASTVLQIFKEIYESPQQFPIKNIGGYSWRGNGTSEHNWGLAVDINWEENYYINLRTGATTGDYWLPGEDPYSIPEDSDVVDIFHKYGFGWGGDGWWSTVRDYMHFSFLST